MESLRLFFCLASIGLLASLGFSDDKKSPVIDGWGKVINQDGDCTVKASQGKLTVQIPNTLHDLNPRNGKLNAPRVMQEVEGDFTVQVRVTGEFAPGKNSTAPQSIPFISAGLLVWGDEKNYLRLERDLFWRADVSKFLCYPPLVEYYRDGIYQETNPDVTTDAFFKGNSTSFRLERKDETISTAYSHDGKDWRSIKEIEVTLPKKVSVGILAINTSDKAFKVEFDQFKLKQR